MSHTIHLDALTIPPRRQRTTMDKAKLNELADSIKKLGLLHPIVVRELPHADPERKLYQLVCGGRRVAAYRLLREDPVDGEKFSTLEATLVNELSDLERREAELEENLLREDLNWQDRTNAIAELHALRLQQNPEQTVKATATEIAKVEDRPLEGARKETARAIIVSRALQQGDKRIEGARNAREAYAIISQSDEQLFTAALAKATGGKTEHVFIPGDMTKVDWPQNIDCLIADPPYGMGADKFGDAGMSHVYDDDPEAALALYKFLINKGFAFTKPSAHMYLFCDFEHFQSIKAMAVEAGWDVFRTPIIWWKGGQTGHDPQPGVGFRRTYETFLYAFKGDRPHKVFIGDVLDIPPVRNPIHAAAKPVELYRRLLMRSCNPGDLALDPCCGSGTIFPAATFAKVNAVGIEKNEEFATVASMRRYEDISPPVVTVATQQEPALGSL